MSAFSRASLTAAIVTVAAIGTMWTVSGGSMFSPGALRAGDSTRVTLGGVESHAQLSQSCGSCHAAPGSGETMGARCLACHTDIVRDMKDSTSVHGALSDAAACMTCHTEHRGAQASLTQMDGSAGAHATLGFPLDGAHAKASCASCHQGGVKGGRFAKAPTTCVGCHERDDKHEGGFGPDCASCHTTTTWRGATFSHDVFPLDHGGEGTIACATCHTDGTNYKQYTCMGCHEHSPARIERQHRGEVNTSNLSDCLRCHRGGRGEGGEGGEHEGRRRRRD